MTKNIYLDYNASTPIAQEAVEAMRPFLTQHYGNPSSHHWAGAPAKDAVERARAQVAGLLDCDPTEIVFTSGGSESNNHALTGVFFAHRERGDRVTLNGHPTERLPNTLSVNFVGRIGCRRRKLRCAGPMPPWSKYSWRRCTILSGPKASMGRQI
ncbi:aminotransferase class V-fold PLP-dependent enzyme [Geoalkalibacter halelectricus]|uniref:Aminotransferase class V-fold PLP-dependent enzyme n=1 Tax=Geoalkalibacter halelectricus TaxID=2847045 RepID=A0ABY5ZRZ3_9BACT|nr:aminotransferase class V-fold PLP-dependent enzyme [Geoalkalibacter halelectricus]MDO3376750.1 aminotransferase class V-fold PLP-dependent enzyme [Geoalkalibacter halelectricus]UWZ81299.1 aminotransferase class V-fold PLP-dependent enzyme [Geoalkalibacter halelectricus]